MMRRIGSNFLERHNRRDVIELRLSSYMRGVLILADHVTNYNEIYLLGS